MKNIFKKIAVIALVMIMCVSSIVPSISAAETTCPGKDYTHTAANCSYTVVAKTEAACLVAGIVTGQCNSCGKRFVAESVEAPGHDWAVSSATCEAPIIKTCKVCGTVDDSAKEIAGHVWSAWTVTGGACKIGERRSRTCSVCDLTQTNIMQEAHNWVVVDNTVPEYCNEPAIAYYACENDKCDATKTAKLWLDAAYLKHNYKDWNETADGKDPNFVANTCSSVGYKSQKCEKCDHVKVLQVAKKTHVASDLKFIDEVFETLGCNGEGKKAYGQCFDCGNRYLAKEVDSTPVYAALGTVYPTFTTLPEGANSADYYVVYNDYNYVKPDGSIEYDLSATLKTAQLVRDDIKHDPYTTYVAESCVADGYYSINCTKCNFNESKILPATGHVYYSDVTSTSDQTKYIDAHGLASSTKWADLAPNKAGGKNVTWKDGAAASCEKNAYVLEICLNVHTTEAHYTSLTDKTVVEASSKACQDDTTITEDNTKEYILTGTGNEALGHQWSLTKGAERVGKPEPTCASTGVWVYTCGNGCTTTKNEVAPALAHEWEKVASATVGGVLTTTKPATCVEDGIQCYDCKKCDEVKADVIVKTADDHAWKYIPTGDFTSSDAVADKVAALKCNQTLEVVRYCNVPECPAGANPVAYTAKGTDHKFYDTANADNLAKIVKLEKPGTGDAKSKIMKDSTSTIVAVEYLVAGDCTKVATYRLNCLYGCGMFKSFEISDGFNTGAHDVVFAGAAFRAGGYEGANGTCTQKDGEDLKEYKNGYWYCAVSTCPYNKKNVEKSGVGEKVKINGVESWVVPFIGYSSHLKADGTPVSYKDVPDVNISGAATLADARNVKAPVDENGNTVYAIDIPGTSLVWRYVADVSCSNDGIVLGGFWCVDCNNGKFVIDNTTTQAGAVVSASKVTYHAQGVGEAKLVTSTCEGYGYTEKACKYCFYTVQEKYVEVADHKYENAVVTTVNPTCEKTGYTIKKCDVCNEVKTEILPATGHHNAAEKLLTTSCLDNNEIDRKCAVCTKVVIGDHLYGADDKCTRCGVSK